MTFLEIEKSFNRAFSRSFSKKKVLLLFPIVALCGLVLVFCRALSFNASRWVQLSLTFLPIFLCFGLLLCAGIVLMRIYYREIKGLHIKYREILVDSASLLVNVTYLSLPFILTYLVLWITLGIFYLLKELPVVGQFISIILSFAPFLLVCSSLVLSIFSLILLFFATPHIALKEHLHLLLFKDVFNRLKGDLFCNLVLLIIALCPILLVVGILSLSAVMTGYHFTINTSSLAIALQWFFIMLPFSALLTPVVIFFFNFSMESYGLVKKRIKRII